MKPRPSFLLAMVVLALAAPTTGRAQVISTLSGGSFAGNGGLYGDYGWGQTFQTPGGVAAALDQFVVRVNSASGQDFQAFIGEWTESTNVYGQYFTVTAPVLWSGTVTGGADNLVVFDTGHLALDAATSYAFYIATTGATRSIPVNNTGPYTAGGAFDWYRANTLSTPNNGYSRTALYDLQFEATFSAISPVPEPASYATLGLALCGLLAFVRRRRPAVAAPSAA